MKRREMPVSEESVGDGVESALDSVAGRYSEGS